MRGTNAAEYFRLYISREGRTTVVLFRGGSNNKYPRSILWRTVVTLPDNEPTKEVDVFQRKSTFNNSTTVAVKGSIMDELQFRNSVA